MEIYQIKTINGGYKGLEVSWTENRKDKSGRKFVDDITKEKNEHIHHALDKAIKDLRIYLLEICGVVTDSMSKPEIDQAIAETEIISIQMKKTFFIIEGEKEWLNSKRFKLKTPKIEGKDNYSSFATVVQILMDIRQETELYMKGEAIISPEEACVRFITSGKDKTTTIDDYNAMSQEDKLAFHKRIIEEEFGGIVMVDEDMQEDNSTEVHDQEEQTIDLNEKEEAF